MSRSPRTLWQVFRAPLLLALLSVVGLVAALVGDGLLDLLSWLTLGSTLLVIAWYWSRPSG